MPSSIVTAARASSSPRPGLTSQRRWTHSAIRTRSMRATRRRASSSSERYSLTNTSRRLPLRSCNTMAASMSSSSADMRRQVLVEDLVDGSSPDDGCLLDENGEELALAVEVPVDGRPADTGRRADVAQACLAEATLPEEVGGGRHDRVAGPLALGLGCVPRRAHMGTDVSHPSQIWLKHVDSTPEPRLKFNHH